MFNPKKPIPLVFICLDDSTTLYVTLSVCACMCGWVSAERCCKKIIICVALTLRSFSNRFFLIFQSEKQLYQRGNSNSTHQFPTSIPSTAFLPYCYQIDVYTTASAGYMQHRACISHVEQRDTAQILTY